ncbi:MAG: TetR/AcrR family transcriptional regulator [Pseudomonadota bacterium]
MENKKLAQPDPELQARVTYHHGSLRASLIAAADDILRERGVEGFTLREAARRAGVSVAAPAHHFGSAAGLLSEVAILGFAELARYLQEAAGETSGAARMRALGMGYVRFALAYPGRFHLMFRHDLLLADEARLENAGQAALVEVERAVRLHQGLAADEPIDRAAHAVMLMAWSTVHGFAHLALDGKFKRMKFNPGAGDALDEILSDVLRAQWPDPAD